MNKPVAWMMIAKGCETGPVETVEETALLKARDLGYAEVRPLYQAPSSEITSREAIIEECAKVAFDMPLKSGEERHDYRWSDTFKAAALDIASAIRALKNAAPQVPAMATSGSVPSEDPGSSFPPQAVSDCGNRNGAVDYPAVAAPASEIRSPYAPSRHFDRTCPECGCGNRLNGNLIHASNCSLKSLSEQETPLRAVVVDGAIQFIVGANVLKHATDICPALWDHENDRGQFRVTNPAVFTEAVTRELNREREDGSTILTDVMDKAVYEAINQGSEGVEEVK